MITRRMFSLGLLAAPAIIRTPGLLMAVRPWSEDPTEWFRKSVEAALMDALTQAGPILYNEAGFGLIRRVFSNVWPTLITITVPSNS